MIRLLMLALVACVSPQDPNGLTAEPAGDHCTITASLSGRELTVTATYQCSVTEVTGSLNAYLRIEDDLFQFGTHIQILSCGSSLTETYRLPIGVTSEVVFASAGFRQGEVYCETIVQ